MQPFDRPISAIGTGTPAREDGELRAENEALLAENEELRFENRGLRGVVAMYERAAPRAFDDIPES